MTSLSHLKKNKQAVYTNQQKINHLKVMKMQHQTNAPYHAFYRFSKITFFWNNSRSNCCVAYIEGSVYYFEKGNNKRQMQQTINKKFIHNFPWVDWCGCGILATWICEQAKNVSSRSRFLFGSPGFDKISHIIEMSCILWKRSSKFAKTINDVTVKFT